MAHDDPALRELFLRKDFRIALSLGVDRDEINEVVHRGSYIPSQVTPNTPFGGMKGYPATSRGEVVPIHARFGVTPRWGQWIVTDGAEGVEPPDDVKRLAEIPNDFMQEPDPAVRAQIEEEIFRIHLDNMWIIGAMNANPDLNFSTFSNRIKNRVGTVWATCHHVASAWYFDE